MPDKAVGVGQLCRSDDLVIRGIQLSVTDILHNCPDKQVRILQYHTKGMAQIRLFDFVDVDAVVADFPVLNIVKTIDKVRDRRLAGPGGAYKGNLLPRCRI